MSDSKFTISEAIILSSLFLGTINISITSLDTINKNDQKCSCRFRESKMVYYLNLPILFYSLYVASILGSNILRR